VGPTRWTCKSPPNYVERSLALLGRTADTGRVWDIAAAARFLRRQYDPGVPIHVAGRGAAGVLAAYAALLEPEIAGVTVVNPPASHMDAQAPQFLNVLRVCDIFDAFGMLAPRPLTLIDDREECWAKVQAAYTVAGASEQLRHRSSRPNHKR
jgi:pimeloyl-ACP methyl ester carboxylesterase